MGRGKEREEGQVSILRAGLRLEPIVELFWGNSAVLTTLLNNLGSSAKSFDQAYSGEVGRVQITESGEEYMVKSVSPASLGNMTLH